MAKKYRGDDGSYVDDDGTIRDSSGRRSGSIDDDGTIRDRSGRRSGSIDNDGTIRDRSGRRSGKIDDDGVVRDRDGKRIGDSGGGGGGGDTGCCYIATAVYGSYDCQEVLVLRRYRDEKLLTSKWGRLLVKLYYKISPSISNKLRHRATLSRLAKKILDSIVSRLDK